MLLRNLQVYKKKTVKKKVKINEQKKQLYTFAISKYKI